MRLRTGALIGATLLFSCAPASLDPASESVPTFAKGPGSASGGELQFFSAPDAPPLSGTTVSFWAVKGADRRLTWYYQPAAGQHDSTEFVRFRVRSGSLLAAPDGTPYQPGDSVLITLSLADADRLIVDFQPSGLTFDPNQPAELEFRMDQCDLDLNHDGVINNADKDLLRSSAIFRQETAADPWEVLGTVGANTNFKAKVNGFTRYVVAY
ncbi:MAG: hypothetical protein AB7L66_02170 [Gemmatimonadales bacterium]